MQIFGSLFTAFLHIDSNALILQLTKLIASLIIYEISEGIALNCLKTLFKTQLKPALHLDVISFSPADRALRSCNLIG
jgi:hypothetical protein